MQESPMSFFEIIDTLPLEDWLALAWFFLCWIGYSHFSKRMSSIDKHPNLLSVTNYYRGLWMRQACVRIQRPLDGIIVQNISSAPSFFASTSLLVIGAVLAMLSSSYEFANLFAGLPFGKVTSLLLFDMKVILLLIIFVFAFFRFSWSMRQYTFASLVIGAMPDRPGLTEEVVHNGYAEKASRLLGLAAEAFNAGVRAYYFSFAVICWFLTPAGFALASTLVAYVLYRREFQSEVLNVMKIEYKKEQENL